MKNKLQDKVAIITGASSGIGLSIAKRLLENKVKVYNISRSTIQGSENIESFQCDVNDTEKVKSIIEEIYKKENRIDIFVNNAGFGIAGEIESASRKNIYNLVETNLSSVITLSSLIIPYLKETKGKIINISSVGAVIPIPYQATYSATKAGVEIFSRALANEVKPFGIKVTTILPGDVKTGFTQNRIVEINNNDKNYSEKVKKSIKKMEKEELKGKSPDSVAKIVVKMLKRKNPPLRKTVGFSYKLVVFLSRILPTRFLNFLIKKIYC